MRRPRRAPPLDLTAPCDIATAIAGNGYGYVRRGDRMVLAHRAAWEDAVGALEPGQQLHHACEDTACREVRHLVLCADQAEHAALHDDGRCRNGHVRTPESTYVSPSGKRHCRTCARAWKLGRAA